MSNQNLVHGGATLHDIFKEVESENHEIWYVDRRARILKMDIHFLDDGETIFIRQRKIKVTIHNEIKNIDLGTDTYKSGLFYDKYCRYGHFFISKNNAVKYMQKRVSTGRKDIIKSAQNYIDTHPECLV